MRPVPVFGGHVAYVDDVDFQLVVTRRWHMHSCGYAMTHERDTTVYMHRLITNAEKGTEVDHCDGNKLNNTRANLRFVTRSQNLYNKPKAEGYSSKYKGVCWSKAARKWEARIRHIPGQQIYLGIFQSEVDAARAYDAAARQYHGEFARLNFPEAHP